MKATGINDLCISILEFKLINNEYLEENYTKFMYFYIRI